ncbi:MAG: hypothetical protein JKX85_00555 [Phycisphaeraceae bacterium]|nr:hypothetical protein [Phycisphaeraceae bacterium]
MSDLKTASDQIDGGFRFMFFMGMAMAVIIACGIGLVYYIATNFGTAFYN